jgi:uncharacterized membrane protein (UPF0136 family)
MTWLNFVVGGIALLSIGGGLQAYIEKQSTMSLMGGLLIGVLCLVSIFLSKSKPTIGPLFSLLACLMLLGQFAKKAGTTPWPALVMTIAGAIGVIAHIIAHFQNHRQ